MLPYAPDAWYRPDKVKTGYEISFNRYFYKPEPMRSLEEIRGDIVALECETEGLLGTLVAESRGRYAVGALRIYADTSVFGGCEDDEFRTPSRRLFEQFRAGAATLLLSEVTVGELRNAPEAVRAIVDQIPEERIERLPISPDAEKLAAAYLESGALAPSSEVDAPHIAIASLAEVDCLASWNFRHMVNLIRIRSYNAVNRRLGYPSIDIRTPREIDYGD